MVELPRELPGLLLLLLFALMSHFCEVRILRLSFVIGLAGIVRFTKYYVLEIFFGARKQVFLTFAPYVLILHYGARTELLALLYGVFSTINIFIAPAIGRLVDRLGYRLIIIADTIALMLICLGSFFFSLTLPKASAKYALA